MTRWPTSLPLMSFVSILMSFGPLLGQDFHWNNPNGGFYHTPSNWSPEGPPGFGHRAIYDLPATYTVTWNSTTGNRQTTSMLVSAGNVTYASVGGPFTHTLTSPGTALTVESNSIFTLGAANAPMRISTTTGLSITVNNQATLRVMHQSQLTGRSLQVVDNAMAEVSGGSTINQTANLTIGGANGSAILTGPGSTWNVVGQASVGSTSIGATGQGTFSILDGATMTSATQTSGFGVTTFIGQTQGAQGFATVLGTNSTWTIGSTAFPNVAAFVVGLSGSGELTVADAGRVATVSSAGIGWNSIGSGKATITGADSTFSVANTLTVGQSGQGILLIQDGGRVTSSTGIIGRSAGSSGQVTIENNGAEYQATNLYVGGSEAGSGGTGTVSINSGGRLIVPGLLKGWQNGTLNLHDGGTLHVHHFDFPGSNFNFVGGTLQVTGNVTGNISAPGGGLVKGTGSFQTLTLADDSTLSPGLSAGHIQINELNWNSGAIVTFDLGADQSESDLITAGALNKQGSGAWAFSFVDNGWQVGQTYDLIHFVSTNFQASDFSFTNSGPFDGTFAFSGNTLTFTLTAIPEPATATTLLAALAVGLCLRRRKR